MVNSGNKDTFPGELTQQASLHSPESTLNGPWPALAHVKNTETYRLWPRMLNITLEVAKTETFSIKCESMLVRVGLCIRAACFAEKQGHSYNEGLEGTMCTSCCRPARIPRSLSFCPLSLCLSLRRRQRSSHLPRARVHARG